MHFVTVAIITLCVGATVAEESPPRLLPAFELDASDGSSVNFAASEASNPAVLIFWATWCPYCRILFPHIEAVRKDYAAQGVDFYALNIWEDGDPKKYFKERGYGMTLLLAADLVAEEFGVRGTPGVYVADGNRRLLYQRQRGEKPEDVEQALRASLDRALAVRAH